MIGRVKVKVVLAGKDEMAADETTGRSGDDRIRRRRRGHGSGGGDGDTCDGSGDRDRWQTLNRTDLHLFICSAHESSEVEIGAITGVETTGEVANDRSGTSGDDNGRVGGIRSFVSRKKIRP